MVVPCCVPGCPSGLKSRREEDKLNGTTLHRFPLRDPYMVFRWRKAIPRENWEPKTNTRICSKHFLSEDFKALKEDKNKYRTRVDTPIHRRCLKSNSVPSIFPEIPKSSNLSSEATSKSEDPPTLSKKKRKNKSLKKEIVLPKFIENLKALNLKLKKVVLPTNVIKVYKEKSIVLFETEGSPPRFKIFMEINETMGFRLFIQDREINRKELSLICPLNRICVVKQVSDILAFAQSYGGNEPLAKIHRCIDILESIGPDNSSSLPLGFILSQLKMSLVSCHGRRFPPDLLATSLLLEKNNSGLYKMMRKDGLFHLPSTERLNRLAKALGLSAGWQVSFSTKDLEAKIRALSSKEDYIASANEDYSMEEVDVIKEGEGYIIINEEEPTVEKCPEKEPPEEDCPK